MTRFVDPSFAFAVNLNYLILWIVSLPLELVVASIIMLVLIVSSWVSLFPVGEPSADTEAFFEGYLSVTILIACHIGSKNWQLLIPLKDFDLNLGRKERTQKNLDKN
ncbi:hypothetical protein TPHA_0A04703 [Tetrapisispora phaffii CBS 4417]|uniref:Amino acid permease/ SLC12A domain-containing protein n=1 Tax=Tetrapisispora phaffii (strain ATCC 24235 / CBS 4417 / NBRC 1672 / NRRL Y-8282 / UCD 70-5) TaxID=1071381 RepID=G8BNR6_TETPH|nr:hypothetical protein TPHA_0A04703 [Tetrapisispora phaffii CBS 4417]CCE61544.1 hypothetical protein TPHA_0A04703 [Tetrapisispora phaffii CBS 4417]